MGIPCRQMHHEDRGGLVLNDCCLTNLKPTVSSKHSLTRATKSFSLYDMKRWIFYPINHGLLVMIFFTVAVSENSKASDAAQAKHLALYAPRPEYPLAARKRHWTGAGVFACKIRSNGTVASVDVLRSTGHQMLDQAAITAFRQWRFQPGDIKAVKIPIDFWMDGSAARRRMSGAVISY